MKKVKNPRPRIKPKPISTSKEKKFKSTFELLKEECVFDAAKFMERARKQYLESADRALAYDSTKPIRHTEETKLYPKK